MSGQEYLKQPEAYKPGFAIWTHLLPRFTLAGGRRDTLTAMLPARKQVNGSFSRRQHPDLAASESWPPSVVTPPPLPTQLPA
jgi:hypothetical protein